MIGERRAARVEIDEGEALPAAERDLDQPVFLRIEVARPVHPVGEVEPAVDPVGPAVIGADDAFAAPFAVEQPGAAMPAAVGEGAEPPVAVADDQVLGAREGQRRIVAGLRPVFGAPDQVPPAHEDARDLAPMERVRGIAFGRQGPGLGKRPPHRLEIHLHGRPSAAEARRIGPAREWPSAVRPGRRSTRNRRGRGSCRRPRRRSPQVSPPGRPAVLRGRRSGACARRRSRGGVPDPAP